MPTGVSASGSVEELVEEFIAEFIVAKKSAQAEKVLVKSTAMVKLETHKSFLNLLIL